MRQDQLTPSKRVNGSATIAVTTKDKARLQRLAGSTPIKAFVTVLLDHYEANPTPQASPSKGIPWDRIEAEFRKSMGDRPFDHAQMSRHIQAVREALEEG